MLNLQPLHDRILVKPEVYAGAIILVNTCKEKSSRGTVVATGPGKLLDDGKYKKLHVKTGDEVLFFDYCGTKVKIDGEEYTVLAENEIIAVIQVDQSSEQENQ